jgi:hypothetical protein
MKNTLSIYKFYYALEIKILKNQSSRNIRFLEETQKKLNYLTDKIKVCFTKFLLHIN